MAVYKAGDRVRVSDPNASPHTDLGQTGTVVEDDSFAPWVEFDKPTRYPHAPTVDGVRRKEGFCDCIIEYNLEPLLPANDLIKLEAAVAAVNSFGMTVADLSAFVDAKMLLLDAEDDARERMDIHEQSLFDDAEIDAHEHAQAIRRMLVLMGRL